MIEPTGYTALDLVGFTDRGTYAANVNYVKNDLVHYGGSIWRILIDDTIGITPAEGPNYTLYIGEPTNLVERIIAPLEDNPATVAYQTGRQIIYNDYLYEVIQNIAVGDILIAYEDDPTNANIKLASPVETQVLALDGRLDTAEADIVALETGKADTSVIAPVESGTTASRAYTAGAHFIKNGAFCTAKTAIAQGETFTLNTNYTAGTIGQELLDITSSVYTDNTSGTIYNIPFSVLQQRHDYGMALVGAWKDLFVLFYDANPAITFIAGTGDRRATVSLNSGVLTITFTATVWGGISVLPL